MKIGKYDSFIPQNVAPYEAKKIGIYKLNGKRIGGFELQNLRLPRLGEKLYSFGVVSDVHVDAYDAETELRNALTFFNNNADFVCICGDLTNSGTIEALTQYKNCVDTYSRIPVYAMAGNHEYYDDTVDTHNIIEDYTGHPLYYSFTHGNDLFLMCGFCENYYAMNAEQAQWIYDTLENDGNRNKRCFIFNHSFLKGAQYSGDVTELYWQDALGNDAGNVFKNMLSHYHNLIFFHGHSHELFEMQGYCQSLENKPASIYDYALGCHSVHIPSLSHPIDISSGERVTVNYGKSQGYLVDVYKNHIVLKGRDFTSGKFLPIAQYCLSTKLVDIESGTFTDETGTIVT